VCKFNAKTRAVTSYGVGNMVNMTASVVTTKYTHDSNNTMLTLWNNTEKKANLAHDADGNLKKIASGSVL
jgi:hypothetical protein